MTASQEARARLLRRCDELYTQERWKDRGNLRPDPGKLIGEGIRAARSAIEAAPVADDKPRYLAELKARIEEVKSKYRADPVSQDGYDDEDGYILGGLSTILREIEKEEASPAPSQAPPSGDVPVAAGNAQGEGATDAALEELRTALASGAAIKPALRSIIGQFQDPNSIVGPSALKVAMDEIQRFTAGGKTLTSQQHADLTEAQGLVLGQGDLEKGLSEFGVEAVKRGIGVNEAMALVNSACQELRDDGRLTDVQHRMTLARFGRTVFGVDEKGQLKPGSPLARPPQDKPKGCALLLLSMFLAAAVAAAMLS